MTPFIQGLLETVGITIVLVVLLWLLLRLERAAAARVARVTEQRMGTGWGGQAFRATSAPRLLHLGVAVVVRAIGLVLIVLWFAFVLRRFPATLAWGDLLRMRVWTRLGSLGQSIVDSLPNLFMVAVIIIAVRAVARLVKALFDAVERGEVHLPSVYPETAAPTRRLVMALLWLTALAMAYPYVPGSGSEGVKGISVFVGLVLSLGSSGVVQHMMSGLMVTFARAVSVGDFANIGGVEGTVTQVGALATKVRKPTGEEITIPNAVVVSNTVTNYSARGDAAPARLRTSVTIGYAVPWRQVEALLLIAAQQTPGILRTPPPRVMRTSLDNFYITYTLLVTPEEPRRRNEVLDGLHTNILDAFNEHGVQIMAPNYEADPESKKVVPQSDWYSAPAVAPAGTLPRAAGNS